MRSDWMSQSKCNTLTFKQANDIFFIGPGKSANKARIFCGTCPVKSACLNYALTYNERGIWAGTTEEERDNMDPWIAERLRQVARDAGTLETRSSTEVDVVAKIIPLPRDEDEMLEALLQSVQELEIIEFIETYE